MASRKTNRMLQTKIMCVFRIVEGGDTAAISQCTWIARRHLHRTAVVVPDRRRGAEGVRRARLDRRHRHAEHLSPAVPGRLDHRRRAVLHRSTTVGRRSTLVDRRSVVPLWGGVRRRLHLRRDLRGPHDRDRRPLINRLVGVRLPLVLLVAVRTIPARCARPRIIDMLDPGRQLFYHVECSLDAANMFDTIFIKLLIRIANLFFHSFYLHLMRLFYFYWKLKRKLLA